MKLGRILETALYAEDLDAAERFYTTVLGLKLHSRETGRHLFFYSGTGMFLVFNPKTTEKDNDFPHTHGCHGSGHVAWAVAPEELDQWQQWLEEKDVIVENFHWPEG